MKIEINLLIKDKIKFNNNITIRYHVNKAQIKK